LDLILWCYRDPQQPTTLSGRHRAADLRLGSPRPQAVLLTRHMTWQPLLPMRPTSSPARSAVPPAGH